MEQALADSERGLGKLDITADDEALDFLAASGRRRRPHRPEHSGGGRRACSTGVSEQREHR